MLHDVFICHASEDKDDFVRPLAERLKAHHLEVWYDEFSLRVGDSLRQAIDQGLSNSRFGIVILSPAFFRKRWTQRELNGLVAREMHEGRELVLPIWHGVTHAEIISHSPPLADVHAIKSTKGIDAVVGELLKKLRPEESPLIVARDFLLDKGVAPPIVTDEWWLDVVEFKEQLRFPGLNNANRWSFPLPHDEDFGRARGENLAWTALQRDWMEEAERHGYCQLTDPEKIHSFIRKWPGLLECCRNNPSILALYVPQLTIPGFDDGLEDVFDRLLKTSYQESLKFFSYSSPTTVAGQVPLCGEVIAWRHPTFGNFTDGEIASSFVYAHTSSYWRTLHGGFTCLVWLLTDSASWLPDSTRARLINGLRTKTYWWTSGENFIGSDNAFFDALWRKKRGQFRFTRSVKSGLVELIQERLHSLGITEGADEIAKRFMAGGFVEGHLAEEEELRVLRAGRG